MIDTSNCGEPIQYTRTRIRSRPICYMLRDETDLFQPDPPSPEALKVFAESWERYKKHCEMYDTNYIAAHKLGKDAYADKRCDYYNGDYKPIWSLYPEGFTEGWDEADDAYNDRCAEEQYLSYYESDSPTVNERFRMEYPR